MNELLKNFLEREFAEIEKNKFRIAGLIFIAATGIFFLANDSSEKDEENILSETPQIEDKNISAENNSDKNISVSKNSEVQKVPNQNVTKILGANSTPTFIKNPFTFSEAEEIEVANETETAEGEKIPAEKNSPPVAVQNVQQKNSPTTEEEKFVLVGIAISENKKTALVEHYSGKNFAGTLFLKVGDNLKGKFVTEITEDSLTLSSGEKLYNN